MIPHLRHPALDTPHGFFGRAGGVSNGPYATLNAGRGSDDDPANVATNLDRVRTTLGATRLLTLHQVHSDRFIHAEDHPDGERVRADGFVCGTPGIAVAALHADCAPVLFHDATARLVGACHAGWRGAVGGITDAVVEGMWSRGATPDGLRAVIGPTISRESYEVGEAFRDAAVAQDGLAAGFFHARPVGGRPWIGDDLHFDLPSYLLARLARAGVRAANIDLCTYADPDRYFSYRYNTHAGVPDYGRNISAIMLA